VAKLVAAIKVLVGLKKEDVREVMHIHPISKRTHYLGATALQLPFCIEHLQSASSNPFSKLPEGIDFSTAVRKGSLIIYCLHSRKNV
jgi:hypothetical protein